MLRPHSAGTRLFAFCSRPGRAAPPGRAGGGAAPLLAGARASRWRVGRGGGKRVHSSAAAFVQCSALRFPGPPAPLARSPTPSLPATSPCRWPYQGKGVAPGAAGGPPKPRQAAQQRGIGEAAVANGPTLSGDVPMHSAGGGAAAHELDGLQHFDEVRARTPSSSGSGSRGSPRSRHGGLPGEARPAGQALSPGLELDHPAAWDYGAGGAGFADLHLNTLPNLQHLKLASGDSPSTHSAGSCSSGTSTSGAAPLGSPERRRAAARPPLPPPAQHHQQPHAAGAPPVAAHLPAQQAHQPRLPPIVVGLPGGPEPAADSQACSAAFLDSNLFLQVKSRSQNWIVFVCVLWFASRAAVHFITPTSSPR